MTCTSIVLESENVIFSINFLFWLLLVSGFLRCATFGSFLLVECALESTKLVIEIDKDVRAGDLHQRVVSSLQEYNVFFVEVAE